MPSTTSVFATRAGPPRTGHRSTCSKKLGLEAYQGIVPVDAAVDVFATEGPCLLALEVPGTGTHFVVFWRSLGPWVQLMDPSEGRRWVRRDHLVRELFVHEQPFDDDAFGEWFPTTGWHRRAKERLRDLGESSLLSEERPLPSMREIGIIDACSRFVERLVHRGAIRRSRRRDALHKLIDVDLAAKEAIRP